MTGTPSSPSVRLLASSQDRLLLELLSRVLHNEVKAIQCAVMRDSLKRTSRIAAVRAWFKARWREEPVDVLDDPSALHLTAILETQALESMALLDQPSFFVADALDSIEAALKAMALLTPTAHAVEPLWHLEEARRLLALGLASASGRPTTLAEASAVPPSALLLRLQGQSRASAANSV